MPDSRQVQHSGAITSHLWPSAGRHLWPSGEASTVQSHERGHLVYAATGVLTVHTADGVSVVPANRIAWTPAQHTHQHSAHGDTDMRIVFLPPSLARQVADRPVVFLASGLAREVLLALTGPHNYDTPVPAYSGAARGRLLRVLVDELQDSAEQPLYLPQPRDDRLRALAQALSDRPDSSASLSEYGKAVGASSRTLSRLMHDELGISFYELRTQVRIYRSVLLLAEGHDVTQTAHACGWSNPSGFIAAFTKIMGTTPGRHQTGQRNTPNGHRPKAAAAQ